MSAVPPAHRTLRITLAYDGTHYAGWQVQPEEATIQSALEQALEQLTGQPIRVTASGRTDAGVHALGQVASCTLASPMSADTLCRALNACTPPDISIRSVSDAGPGFHAIRDAIQKRYRYVIQDGGFRDPFLRNYAWQTPARLDEQAMATAARLLLGTHDFASFQASGSPRVSTTRTITEIVVERRAGDLRDRIEIEVTADGFLYNMVRNIVGTLVEIGRGNESPAWISRVLSARDRRMAGPTAPPQGLFLVWVRYPGDP